MLVKKKNNEKPFTIFCGVTLLGILFMGAELGKTGQLSMEAFVIIPKKKSTYNHENEKAQTLAQLA